MNQGFNPVRQLRAKNHYDTATAEVVTNAARTIPMGETLDLTDLGLTAVFVSAHSIDQSMRWIVHNPSSVYIDANTGSITGLIGDQATIITASHNYNGFDYQCSYSLSILPLPDGTYFIKNAATNRHIDISSLTIQDFAPTCQSEFSGSTTQRWIFTHLGNNVYSIHSADSTTEYYLKGDSVSGQEALISTGGLTEDKKWNIRFTEAGTIVLIAVTGSNNDLSLAATTEGTAIQLLTYSDDENQTDEWLLCPQKDYALMFIGAFLGDPEMIPILESVDTSLTQGSFNGYANTSMSIRELLEHLSSSNTVMCISHGNATSLVCSDGPLTINHVNALAEDAFADLKFVYLCACNTGFGQTIFADNLVNALSEQGADNVLGFGISIRIDEANFWSKHFMYALTELHGSIEMAMAYADAKISLEDKFSDRALTVSEGNRYFVGDASTFPFG